MLPFLDSLRILTYDNSVWVALFRLGVAVFCGGCIGLERGRKRRPAGFRTHILVCIGAALAMLISQYMTMMTDTYWAAIYEQLAGRPLGNPTDAARLGAQVINGIGFLGAGTIIVTGQQEVKGLTTAAGLWASACMGLCIGAGFVEGAVIGCILIIVTIIVFTRVERVIMACSRNINLYVEFANVDDVGAIISTIKAQDIRIFDVEIRKAVGVGANQSAVFCVRLPKRMSHATVMTVLAELEHVRSIEEL
ncbi:MAG: MgtC/SapB family protein [Ruminococcaceae bacterium]|nr:MgtC/SapB family protein [Oscillospiraceae bacterium]